MSANQPLLPVAFDGERLSTLTATGYRTLVRSDSSDLDSQVEEFLRAGWALYGPPRYQPRTKHEIESFAQTLVWFSEGSG